MRKCGRRCGSHASEGVFLAGEDAFLAGEDAFLSGEDAFLAGEEDVPGAGFEHKTV